MKKVPIKIGQKCNQLTVIGRSKQTKPGAILWDCRCECGRIAAFSSGILNAKKRKTCGCAKAKAFNKNGERIPYESHWYQKVSRIMSYARSRGTPLGFRNAAEFVMYLDEIAPKKCPVFNKPLVAGIGKHGDMSPSIDKIIPSKGYVKGNIQVISYMANRMKNNANPRELVRFAEWILKGGSNAATH